MGSAEIRRRREQLFAEHPFCHYCEVQLVSYPLKKHERMPDNYATLHHQRSRLHPYRHEKVRNGEIRRVLACRQCADLIAQVEEGSLPIDYIRERAGRFPKVDEPRESSSDKAGR